MTLAIEDNITINKRIFFDIDGVLHPVGIAFEDEAGGIYCDPEDQRFMSAGVLAELIEPYPGVVLICHSSWRHRYDQEALRVTLPPSLAVWTVGLTDLYVDRHRSILDFLARHGIAPDAYMVLDDEGNAFAPGTPRLVRMSGRTGISTPTARAAITAALHRVASTSTRQAR